jgi:PleD family two-component response regulator
MELDLTIEKINSFNSINSLYNHYAYKKKTLNILIIDDDENVSTMLEDYLSLRGHYVEIVCEGTRGITKNNLKKYDIIFIDYHLDNDLPPNISKNNLNKDNILTGATVSEIINLQKNDSIIFGYTGDSTKNAINKFKSSGADGIIFKPLEPEIFDKLMFNIESSRQFDKDSFSNAFKSLRENIIIF